VARATIAQLRRVAIVDDSLKDADLMGELVREAGLEPVIIKPPFGEIEQLVGQIRSDADGAVCDHRLRGMAHFSGAQAVASLVQSAIPAILVTQYIDIDADVSIRRWRHQVPVLLSRDDADPDRIKAGLEDCVREIEGSYLPGRRPRRALIQIDGRSDESGEEVVEARIPSWNPNIVVRFPLSLIPENLQEKAVQGGFLFAMVNIGAETPEELYFRDFEAAPDPEPEEGVA